MVVAGAFSDALVCDLKIDLHYDSFWNRLRRFMERIEVRLNRPSSQRVRQSGRHRGEPGARRT